MSLINVWKIDVGDEAPHAVANAIANRQISQGALTEELENRLATLLGAHHVVCTTSGTNALLLAYLVAGIGPGSEVILPDRTWVATANAALLLGAKVAVIDVHPNTPLMDPSEIENAITPATKIIVPVHLNGRQAFIDQILEIAGYYEISVVEDTCQALLSHHQGQHLGTFGRFGCFSMGMAKQLPAGQGGFVVCKSPEDAEHMRRLRNHGLSGSSLVEQHGRLGGNFKFTDMQAALALAQLDLLESRRERQKWIQKTYCEGLANLSAFKWIEVNMDAGAVPLRPEFLCSDRNRFVSEMFNEKIEVMPNSPNLSAYGHIGSNYPLPNASIFTEHMVTLPGGPGQNDEDIYATIEAIQRLAKDYPDLVLSQA